MNLFVNVDFLSSPAKNLTRIQPFCTRIVCFHRIIVKNLIKFKVLKIVKKKLNLKKNTIFIFLFYKILKAKGKVASTLLKTMKDRSECMLIFQGFKILVFLCFYR